MRPLERPELSLNVPGSYLIVCASGDYDSYRAGEPTVAADEGIAGDKQSKWLSSHSTIESIGNEGSSRQAAPFVFISLYLGGFTLVIHKGG